MYKVNAKNEAEALRTQLHTERSPLYIQFYQPNWLLNNLWDRVYFMLTVIFKNDKFIGFLQIR